MVKQILKPNNTVRIKFSSEFDPFGEHITSVFKIISELRHYVVLDNGYMLYKSDGRPYNFVRSFVEMVEIKNGG